MADKFEVIIGAVDQASPVFQKIKKQLEGVQTSSKNIATGLQSMADKAKWAFAAMSGAVVGAVKVFTDFENAMAKVATQLPGEAIEEFGEMEQAVQDMSVTFGQSTSTMAQGCLLYTSDAADDLLCVDLGGRRIIKKKIHTKT